VLRTLGPIGAPLLLTSVLGRMIGLLPEGSAFDAIALAPIFFWELSVGSWMTFKGFNAAALATLRQPWTRCGDTCCFSPRPR
jgi:hypothetical protein